MERPREPMATDRVLFAGTRVRIGAFRCPAEHPNFRHEGGLFAGYDFVFPRSAVWIRHAGEAPFVADTATVTLYNRGQDYERAPIDDSGDRSDWFQVDQVTAIEAVNWFEPVRGAEEERPLRFAFAPADPDLYWGQRRLFRRIESGESLEPMEVEEEVVGLLHRVLANAYAARGMGPRLDPASGAAAAVRRARRVLAERFREPLTLGDVAAAAGVSMFHLARSFHRATGITVHAWLTRLRLHAALEEIGSARWGDDLSAVALNLGFSSHSHFTAAFRRAFGCPPSALRPLLRARAAAPASPARRFERSY